jgi:hypothetical protein
MDVKTNREKLSAIKYFQTITVKILKPGTE